MMTEPRTFTIGQTLDLDAGDFTIAGYGNGTFRLRNELTSQYELMSHRELSRLLPPGQPLETSVPPKPEKTLDEALDDLDDETRFLIPHLQELIDGTPTHGDLRREEYGMEIPMTSKLLSKAKQLREAGHPISDGTLKRRMLRFRKGGVAALTDGRTSRQEAPLSRVHEKVKEALAELIASYTGRSSPSYTRIRAELNKQLILRFPDPTKRPDVPSLKTVERYVIQLSGAQNPTKPAKQRETAALAPDRQFKPRLVSAPGDECQVDSTVFDVRVRFPDGTIARPHLTILVDKRTRSIMGHNFTAGAPTGYDHAMLLADTLVPRRQRSWAKYYDSFGLPQMPWSAHLDEEQLKEYDTFPPYIFPRRIIIDNGQDYRSVVFRLACERYGIHLTESPPKDPTAKAIVERTFGSINTKFAQYLSGYVQSNIQSRGEKVESEEVLDLNVVSELFDRWVAVIWQNRQHDGLVDQFNPSLRHTPNSMFAASLELSGHFVASYEEEDIIALMPTELRTVQSDGIEIRGRKYDSPHLGPMRARKTRDGDTARVAVHYDPSDKFRVWVRSTEESGEWIVCTWTEEEGMSRPLEHELSEEAHRLTRESASFTDARADDVTLYLLDEILEEEVARKNAELAAEKPKARTAAPESTVARVLASATSQPSDFEDFADLQVV